MVIYHSLAMHVEESHNHEWHNVMAPAQYVMLTYCTIVNGDGLRTMVSQMKDTLGSYTRSGTRREWNNGSQLDHIQQPPDL